ncbi:MAG: MoaD/ThiS family protein [Desulfovibrio sp.]|jgi:molybdopterin converting factor small subunit|nr:MoaD/ThiS family protein [Desulfovibrio sp.]
MAVTVLIPTALRVFTGRQAEVIVEGCNVGEALKAFTDVHPDVRQHLYDEKGDLRSFINVYVGETNIRNAGGQATPLENGETLTLVPAIAGGAARIRGNSL